MEILQDHLTIKRWKKIQNEFTAPKLRALPWPQIDKLDQRDLWIFQYYKNNCEILLKQTCFLNFPCFQAANWFESADIDAMYSFSFCEKKKLNEKKTAFAL